MHPVTKAELQAAKRPLRLRVFGAIGVSVVLFVVSLFFPATHYEVVDHDAVLMLMIGWLGPLGMHVGWYANPLLLAAWIFSLVIGPRSSISAVVFAVSAVVVGATSYYTLAEFSMFGRNEGEMAGDLLGYGIAIHLWMASLVAGLGAAIVSALLSSKLPRAV